MEQTFPYDLYIVNRLATPIYYCEEYEAAQCPRQVSAGQSERIVYMSHSRNGNDNERYEAFDRQKIKMCGRLVEFKAVRAISPIVKRDKDRYEIVIDKSVYDAFCDGH